MKSLNSTSHYYTQSLKFADYSSNAFAGVHRRCGTMWNKGMVVVEVPVVDTVVRKIYVLDGGEINVEASIMVSGHHPGTKINVPVQYFLVETSRGFILVDTGNDPDVIEDPEKVWGRQLVEGATPNMKDHNHPLRQLGLAGIDASDIKMVVYTHLHHDHCGGARFFPDALHLVQKAEYRWAFAPDRFSSLPYIKTDYDYPDFNWVLAEGDWCFLPGIQLISTPGHTPGHQSVVLWDVPDVGPVILAGDAINSCENVISDTPGGITSDATAAAESIHRITALADAVDASIIVSHDLEFFHQLPKAPHPLTRLTPEARTLAKRGVASVYRDIANPSNLI